jgi:hypothetical protein
VKFPLIIKFVVENQSIIWYVIVLGIDEDLFCCNHYVLNSQRDFSCLFTPVPFPRPI